MRKSRPFLLLGVFQKRYWAWAALVNMAKQFIRRKPYTFREVRFDGLGIHAKDSKQIYDQICFSIKLWPSESDADDVNLQVVHQNAWVTPQCKCSLINRKQRQSYEGSNLIIKLVQKKQECQYAKIKKLHPRSDQTRRLFCQLTFKRKLKWKRKCRLYRGYYKL